MGIATVSDLASLFSILAVLITLIAIIVENRRARLSLQADLLLRLDEKLHSQELKSFRRIAAKKLLKNERPNPEDEMLNALAPLKTFLHESHYMEVLRSVPVLIICLSALQSLRAGCAFSLEG